MLNWNANEDKKEFGFYWLFKILYTFLIWWMNIDIYEMWKECLKPLVEFENNLFECKLNVNYQVNHLYEDIERLS